MATRLALDALVRLTRCYGANKNLWRARSASRSGGRRRAFRTHWLNHPRRSAQAPGAPEEFVGSSATFVSCVWLIRHVAAFGNAVLEIIPLRCISEKEHIVVHRNNRIDREHIERKNQAVVNSDEEACLSKCRERCRSTC